MSSDLNSMKGTVSISDEKQFIYHDAHNRGHNQIPNMILSCVGLSNNAKAVYGFISRHVFEKGQTAFPSVHRIAFSCGCSVKSAISYVDELDEKGLIVKEHRGKGKSNQYTIVDCHEVPLLKVSEMFWDIASSLQKQYNWRSILPAKDRIVKEIESHGIRLQDIPTDDETKEQVRNAFISVLEGGEAELGFLPKNIKLIVTDDVAPSPQAAPPAPKASRPKGNKGFSLGVDKNHYRAIPDVNDWGIEQFKEFYYDMYLDKTEHIHPRNVKKHTGMVRRVLTMLGEDKETLKLYMETMFKIGYDNVTLEYFCTSNRIGEIQTFLTSGKKPFYLEKGNTPSPAAKPLDEASTQYKGMSRSRLNKLIGGDE